MLMKRLAIVFLLSASLPGFLAAPAQAVKPGRWVHGTEADFAHGKTQQTVITNLNQIRLATGTTMLAELPDPLTLVSDLALLGDKLFLAAGPQGLVLSLQDGALETLVSLADQQVFSLAAHGQREILVGVSGRPSRLLAIAATGEIRTLVQLPQVRYIWDMLATDGRVYLATGTQGRLLEVDLAKLEPVDGDGDPGEKKQPSALPSAAAFLEDEPSAAGSAYPPGVREIYRAKQNNLLCLGIDAQKRIYAGTDTDGLVYRLTPGGKSDGGHEVFVLFDAGEPEIGALLVQPDGTVFVGTADARQARPGRMIQATDAPTGRMDFPAGETESLPEGGEIPALPPKPSPQGTAPFSEPVDAAPTQARDVHVSIGEDSLRRMIEKRLQAGRGDLPTMAMDDPREERVFAASGASGPMDMDDPDEPILPGGQALPRRAMGLGGRGGMMPGMDPGMGPIQPGNAVYRIDPRGFVTELFRESVMILRLAQDNGQLLVTTGNEGMIFRLDPQAGETLRLVDAQPQQISAILALPGGEFLLGTANPAQVMRLHSGFADAGNYTSPSLDAHQISLWGRVMLRAEVPPGTQLTLQTRSGNVEDPEHAPWSDWSAPMAWEAEDTLRPVPDRWFTVSSPPARFLQYRLNFQGTPLLSPAASRVELAYITPNQKPVISAIRALYPHQQQEGALSGFGAGPRGPGGGRMGMPPGMNPAMMRAMMQQRQGFSGPGAGAGGSGGSGGSGGGAGMDLPEAPQSLPIEWDASDPNGDSLVFKVEYQPLGGNTWILLEKELSEPRFDWPVRRMPDGWYRVRVTASDLPDNTPDMAMTVSRVSDPILIDNTPPQFHDIQIIEEKGILTLTATVTDALSPIAEVRYALNSVRDWQPVLPEDKIYDSTSERITIKLTGLGSGQQVLTLRALDGMGQARFHALMLDVKP